MQYLLQFQMGTLRLEELYEVELWLEGVIEKTKGFQNVEAVKHKSGGKGKKRIQ